MDWMGALIGGESYPEREYILTELHYRNSIPIAPLSIITHVTFVEQSFHDQYYQDLAEKLIGEIKDARSRMRAIFENDSEQGTVTRLTDPAIKWLTNTDRIHPLMFGAIDRIKSMIEDLYLSERWDEGESATPDLKCIGQFQRVFHQDKSIYELEEIITSLSVGVIQKLEEGRPRPQKSNAILKQLRVKRDSREVYAYTDLTQTGPEPSRRKRFWVYRIQDVKELFGSRPFISLLWSHHFQNWNWTWILSYSDRREDPATYRSWERLLFGHRREAFELQTSDDNLCVINHLPPLEADAKFPGKRLSGSNYIFIPFHRFVLQCIHEMLCTDDDTLTKIAHHKIGRWHALETFVCRLAYLTKQSEDGQALSGFAEEWNVLSATISSGTQLAHPSEPKLQPRDRLRVLEEHLGRINTRLARKEFEARFRFAFELEARDNFMSFRRTVDELVAEFAKPVFQHMFRKKFPSDTDLNTSDTDSGPELVASRLASDRAYFISDLVPTGLAGLVYGVIIDVGLSRHQRGRLIQRLAEISTFRTLVLRDMSRVRASLEGMAFTTHQLSVSQTDDGSNLAEAPGSGDQDYGRHIPLLRKKLHEMRILQNRLLRYNFLISYGIQDKAVSAASYRQLLNSRLAMLKESKIGPHVTLGGFLERRLLGTAGNIERASHRFAQLRADIEEHLDAIRTVYQFAQDDRTVGGQDHGVALMIIGEIIAGIGGVFAVREWLVVGKKDNAFSVADYLFSRETGIAVFTVLIVYVAVHLTVRAFRKPRSIRSRSKRLHGRGPPGSFLGTWRQN